ncbi:MAG: tail fiber domain-containing protein [Chitinophagaceae bacterium]
MKLIKRTGTCSMIIQSILLLLVCTAAYTQNVAINTDGSPPDKNAMLDIKSINKGVLIPRITTEARMKIPNTQGLLVYDINTNSFWYNNGKLWQNIGAAAAKIADSAWALTGNAGTSDMNNFIGTTDNVPFNVRVNNRRSGRIDPVMNNVFWGYQAGLWLTSGRDNTGIGTAALHLTTTGYDNTALGANSLQNNSTGFSNTSVGRFSLYYNLTGAGNTAVGTSALHGNIRGLDNTAVGGFALSGGGGNGNTAVGSSSQIFGGGSNQNTSLGANSLAYYQRGDGNTAVGYDALRLTAFTAAYNTAVGFSTYISPFGPESSGSYSTVIGAEALATGNNSTALGYGAVSNAPNKVRIGNAAVTVIEGQVPFTTPSDGRFKFGVQEDVKGLDFILQLRPVTYHFDVKGFDIQSGSMVAGNTSMYDEAARIRRSGFIAQEVEDAAMRTGYDFSGIIKPKTDKEHYSLSYDAFVVPLVKAVQEQQAVIDAQQKKITEQQQVNDAQNKKLAELERKLNEIKKLLKH